MFYVYGMDSYVPLLAKLIHMGLLGAKVQSSLLRECVASLLANQLEMKITNNSSMYYNPPLRLLTDVRKCQRKSFDLWGS